MDLEADQPAYACCTVVQVDKYPVGLPWYPGSVGQRLSSNN